MPYFTQVIAANKSRPGPTVFAMVNQLMSVCNRLTLDFTTWLVQQQWAYALVLMYLSHCQVCL